MAVRCSVVEGLVVERGGVSDYESLAGYHYRGRPCRPFAGVYVMRRRCGAVRLAEGPAGVIVYVNPPANHALRNAATGGVFSRIGDRREQLRAINRKIRTIARVIVEPRYRGLGLAARLVRETMGLMGVAMIEATAAAGGSHSFFGRAGMRRYDWDAPAAAVRMESALASVGIGRDDYVDAELVQRKLEGLAGCEAEYIDGEMRRFIRPCVNRRGMERGLERTRFVLGRLGGRRVYYLWGCWGDEDLRFGH